MAEIFDFDLSSLEIFVANAEPGGLKTTAARFWYDKSQLLFAETATANNHIRLANFNHLSHGNLAIIYPSSFKMLDSEPLSDFISRRSDLIMVTLGNCSCVALMSHIRVRTYLMAGTTKWDCSKASTMGLGIDSGATAVGPSLSPIDTISKAQSQRDTAYRHGWQWQPCGGQYRTMQTR